MFGSTLTTQLDVTDSVIARRDKIELAISAQVEKLPDLIEARLDREREFRALECRAAIGEPAPGLDQARKATAGAKIALEEASLRLGGLRRARSDMGPELVSAYDGLKAELPGHETQIVATFASEWIPVVTAFSRVLGRRSAIEKFLGGEKIGLAEPVPEPVAAAELGDIALPYTRLSALQDGIRRIREMQQAAEAPDVSRGYVLPGSIAPHYDPAGVYVITANQGVMGHAYLSKAVDATFDHGRMESLVLAREARPVQDVEDPGVGIAARKLAQIEREAIEKEERDEARRVSGAPPRSSTPLERQMARPDDSEKRARQQAGIDGKTLLPTSI